MINKEDLKLLIIKVNSSLPYYDPDYISTKRYPKGEKIRIQTFRQYIECRLNYELSSIPEIYDFLEQTEGHIFRVVSIINQNDIKRRFSEVTVELDRSFSSDEDFQEILNAIEILLGGTRLRFNYSQKKTKIFIE